MPSSLSNAELDELKARGQRLEPILKIGHAGVSEPFLKSLNEVLAIHELVKIKFVVFKKEKKRLAPLIAKQTDSELIMRVGNVAVLYRRKPEAAASPEAPAP